jgi:acyl-CoA thioesterase-1
MVSMAGMASLHGGWCWLLAVLPGAPVLAQQPISPAGAPVLAQQPISPADSAPVIAFPGQYAPRPKEKFAPWPQFCRRFTEAAERAACYEHVVFDFGRLDRYAAANAALVAPKSNERRVVFFGDSITDNWSKQAFGGFFPGKPYVNRGIGGQTTAQMLVRMRADVIDLKPAVVVILAGTNDVSGNAGPMTPEGIEANLASLAELARASNIKVVLASLLPVGDDKTDPAGKAIMRSKDRPPGVLRALNQWIAGYARKSRHVFLDYYGALADSAGTFKPQFNYDGLHPNAAGYAVMGPLAEKAIAEALRR